MATTDDDLDALVLAPNHEDVVRAMRDYLREQGTATKKDFLRDLYPEHTGGIEGVNYWWQLLGRSSEEPSCGALSDLPNVETPENEGQTWRWVDDD